MHSALRSWQIRPTYWIARRRSRGAQVRTGREILSDLVPGFRFELPRGEFASLLIPRGHPQAVGLLESRDLEVRPLTSLVGREVAPRLVPARGSSSGLRSADVRKITPEVRGELLFAWNGDAAAGGRFDLYSRGLDSERLVRITYNPATALHAAMAPDGKQIAVARGGGLTEQLTEKRTYRAVVTGSRVIFNVAGDSGVQLWSKPVNGGAEAPLEGMGPLRYSDSWTATPRGVYYTSSGARSATVGFYDFATRETRVVRTLDGLPLALGGLGIAVSADQRWLLYTRSERSEGDIMLIHPAGGAGK